MAKAGNLGSQRSFFNPIFNPCHPSAKTNAKTFRLLSHSHTNYNNATATVTASTKRKDNLHSPLVTNSLPYPCLYSVITSEVGVCTCHIFISSALVKNKFLYFCCWSFFSLEYIKYHLKVSIKMKFCKY